MKNIEIWIILIPISLIISAFIDHLIGVKSIGENFEEEKDIDF